MDDLEDLDGRTAAMSGNGQSAASFQHPSTGRARPSDRGSNPF